MVQLEIVVTDQILDILKEKHIGFSDVGCKVERRVNGDFRISGLGTPMSTHRGMPESSILGMELPFPKIR